MSGKVFEAKEHCKAAEKAMKTSVFRWKPDYDSAADEYSQAAQCYRIARDMKNSMDCHLKASECFKKNHAFFHAAKSLENAMIVFKEATPPEEIYNLAMESCSLFQQHGSGDSGASVLNKAAKLIEATAPELAVKLFQQAADVSSLARKSLDTDESDTAEDDDESDSGNSKDSGNPDDTEDTADTETSDDELEDVLVHYRNKVPKKDMEYYRSKVTQEALQHLISELGADPFAPGVLEKHAAGKYPAKKTEYARYGVALTKSEQIVKAHVTFLNVMKEMGAYYFEDPDDTDEVKLATRELLLFIMGYYQRIVQRNTRPKLRHRKRMAKYIRITRKKKREYKKIDRAVDAYLDLIMPRWK